MKNRLLNILKTSTIITAVTFGVFGLSQADPNSAKDCDQISIAMNESSVPSSAPIAIISENFELYPNKVVELYTSQGCSSCPRADQFLSSLKDDPSVLALSFNVSYWDYLGWKDRFGAAEFGQRQRSYAKHLDLMNVYTPQFILNGTTHSNSYSRKQLSKAELPSTRPRIDTIIGATTLSVSKADQATLRDFSTDLVSYLPGVQTTKVSRGENGGRTLENFNVVHSITRLDSSNNYTASREDGLAYALLISHPLTGELISTTRFK